MQSFSTTHCLQFTLRERYVWKLRMSSTKRLALLQECHESCKNRTRNMVYKIHKTKTQDHLGNHQAIRKVTGKSVATPWITEYLEYLFLQSSSRIQNARTRSTSWSRSSRTTSIKHHSFRTWTRRRRSTSSAKNRKTWSPTWTTPRSSNFAKIPPNSDVLTAMPAGIWKQSIAAVEEMWSPRGGPTEFDQNNRDVTSIPGHVIKQNRSRGAQARSFWKTKDVLPCETGHPTILSWWYASDEYRKSLSAIGWKEHHIMLYDRIAVEKRIFVASRAERIQKSKHWILTQDAGGPQQPLNQRPDFAQAKRECKRLHDEYMARTRQEYRTIPRSQQVRQRKGQQFQGNEEYDYAVDQKKGWRIYRHLRQDRGSTCQKLRHRRQRGIKPSGRRAIGILSILQALTTGEFFLRVRTGFGCCPTNRRVVWTVHTNTARTELHSITTFHHANRRGSRLRIAHLCVPRTIVIHVSCLIPCRTWHWPQAQVLSHPFHPLLLSFRRSHLHKQDLWFSTHIYPATVHGRVADQ